MRVLIACEFSGVVRDAFLRRGHKAISCDLLPTETPGPHIQGDVLEVLKVEKFDLMIAHPPCTYLSVSGLHWNNKISGRKEKTAEALDFVAQLWNSHVPRICIENPVGCLSTYFNKPTQIIQPYEFGHDASKKTCLWLKDLPKLIGRHYIQPRIVDGKPRWSNQTNSGQNRLGPSANRWKLRSVTYQGVADAMAAQWSRE